MDSISIALVIIALVSIPMIGLVLDKKRRDNLYENKDITDWEELIAKTTGRTNRIIKTPFKSSGYEYTEYEITYEVNGVTYYKWFDLYPGPELGDIYGEGASVLIKYSESDPDEFDVISVLGDGVQIF